MTDSSPFGLANFLVGGDGAGPQVHLGANDALAAAGDDVPVAATGVALAWSRVL
ncbi:hypothetical protein [Leekyejoonella antrihumi]|uniref:hypothetical protein n=1 Tax=Leekyejoonella antrihumi TaxID=1660198 RepID=UPI001644D16F|nr:hypothetical protein [Leekyejoonella antrihumi]